MSKRLLKFLQKIPVEARITFAIVFGIMVGVQIGFLSTMFIQREWSYWASIIHIPNIPPENLGAIGIILIVLSSIGCALGFSIIAYNLSRS